MSPCAGGNAWGIWERRRETVKPTLISHIIHADDIWKKLPKLQMYCRELSLKIKMKLQKLHLLYGYPIHEETPETMNERVHLENYILIFMSFNSLFLFCDIRDAEQNFPWNQIEWRPSLDVTNLARLWWIILIWSAPQSEISYNFRRLDIYSVWCCNYMFYPLGSDSLWFPSTCNISIRASFW